MAKFKLTSKPSTHSSPRKSPAAQFEDLKDRGQLALGELSDAAEELVLALDQCDVQGELAAFVKDLRGAADLALFNFVSQRDRVKSQDALWGLGIRLLSRIESKAGRAFGDDTHAETFPSDALSLEKIRAALVTKHAALLPATNSFLGTLDSTIRFFETLRARPRLKKTRDGTSAGELSVA